MAAGVRVESAVFNKTGVEKLISRHRNVPKASWPGQQAKPTSHFNTIGQFHRMPGQAGQQDWEVDRDAPNCISRSASENIHPSTHPAPWPPILGRHACCACVCFVCILKFCMFKHILANTLQAGQPSTWPIYVCIHCMHTLYVVLYIFLFKESGPSAGSARSLKLIAAI